MSARTETFERAWSRIEAGVSLRDTVAAERGVNGHLTEPLLMATAVRDLGERIAVPSPGSSWPGFVSRLDLETTPVRASRARRLRRMPARRVVVRALAAAMALIVILAPVSMGATPGSILYPVRTSLERVALAVLPGQANLHAGVAEARLEDLLYVLENGPMAAAPGLSRALMAQRAVAISMNADTTDLDGEIGSRVPPALKGVPEEIAAQVRAALAGLIPPVADEAIGGEGSENGERGVGPGASRGHGRGALPGGGYGKGGKDGNGGKGGVGEKGGKGRGHGKGKGGNGNGGTKGKGGNGAKSGSSAGSGDDDTAGSPGDDPGDDQVDPGSGGGTGDTGGTGGKGGGRGRGTDPGGDEGGEGSGEGNGNGNGNGNGKSK